MVNDVARQKGAGGPCHWLGCSGESLWSLKVQTVFFRMGRVERARKGEGLWNRKVREGQRGTHGKASVLFTPGSDLTC